MKLQKQFVSLMIVVFLSILLPAVALAGPPRSKRVVRKPSVAQKLLPPGAVQSARAVKATPIKHKKVTRMDFDNDLVTANPDQGAGALVTAIRKRGHSSLLRVRTNFLPELIKSAENL